MANTRPNPLDAIPATPEVVELLRRYLLDTRQLHMFAHWLKEQGIDPVGLGITVDETKS